MINPSCRNFDNAFLALEDELLTITNDLFIADNAFKLSIAPVMIETWDLCCTFYRLFDLL